MMALIFKLKHANATAYMHLVSTFVTAHQLAKTSGKRFLRFSDAPKVFVSASSRRLARATLSLTAAFVLTSSIVVAQQQESVEARLKGLDSYMDQVMKDWNS